MRARLFLISLGVIAAAGGPALANKPRPRYIPADCDTAMAKLQPVIEELLAQAAKEAGKPATKPDMSDMTRECKANVSKAEDPGIDCVLRAADRPAVRACLEDATKAYQAKAKRVEASLAINKLKRNLAASVVENSAFPAGTAKTLPAKPCCPQPNHQCAVTPAWAKDPVWAKLEFSLDAPSLFQYSYRSDGVTAHVTAVGDPMCSGKPITFSLDGKLVDGAAVFSLTEPPN